MHRILFYVLKNIAFLCRLFSDKLYMRFIILAYRKQGVVFEGKPEYIDYASYIDPSGSLTIGNRVVISTKVIILTHDWSFWVRYHAQPSPVTPPHTFNNKAFSPVCIGDHSFIGAGAILLPGSKIGKFCIIGSGAVVKGKVEDYSIIIGNPAEKIGDTRDPKYILL